MLTDKQRKNCETLADYLESLPEGYAHFEMRKFLTDFDHEASLKYVRENGGVASCGTAACAVGHGPAAGIFFRDAEILDFGNRIITLDWCAYSENFLPQDAPEWEWAFGGAWARADNHHYGAAARLRYILAGEAIPEEPEKIYVHTDFLHLYRRYDKRYQETIND